MKQLLRIVFLFPLLISCNSEVVKDLELHNLVSSLVGEFSNIEQAKNDSGFAHLNLTNIRIWKDRPGYWIYSEVSDAKENDYIYSQRILSYERLDSFTFINTSYIIRNAKDYKNILNNKHLFNQLTLDSLEIRKGCQVYFEKNTSTIYTGKTKKKSCSSSINYIEYISSNFVISSDKISIWNKGYDKKGKQIWGKITGPYMYKRVAKK
ncbi:chromophore lyase CpcT/CpeT [Aquimarina mytili]|uniref:Chromophore lyase CpcT/CpeT n=1 Tax=Aquimarina mytili TaxID=874423 RepID=A0A937A0B5_9FLAO|nr:chromophore lyase CpcT/CpeT [Aquimarina mytili]MBL0685170.1 chromophore lyase CpcT/CpeT [Aquimarina mytili]